MHFYRRKALKKWKQKLGSKATYKNLSKRLERAGYKTYADVVRKLSHEQDLTDSFCQDAIGEPSKILSSPPLPVFPEHVLPLIAKCAILHSKSQQGIINFIM